MTRILFAAALAAASSFVPAVAQTPPAAPTARGEWSADTRQSWSDEGERRIQLNLRTDDGSRWGSGVRVSELEGLPPAAHDGVATDVRFAWTREAGTFRFEGSFDRGRGNGTFSFAASPAYVSGMASLGYRNLTSDNILRLAFIDVTQAYTRSIRDAGYPAVLLEDLVRMRIHRVTAEEIRTLASLGYKALDVEDLIKFRIHKVTPDFIRALAERNYRGLLADDLVKMKIHKVTPEFIRSIHEVGYRTISIEQLVKMRIHKVDAQFIRDLQADGYKNLSASDVIDFAIRGPRLMRPRRP